MLLRNAVFATLVFAFASCAQSQKNTRVKIHTSLGDITLMLYNETPLHRDNFLKLVNEHYFDSLLFHRVIGNFMVQGGDPDSRHAVPGQMLGNGGPAYTIPAEINYPLYFHKKGALAAARQGDSTNPEKRSSGSQFYIVQGETYVDDKLAQLQANLGQKKKQQAGHRAFAPFTDSLRYYAEVRDSARWADLRNRAVAIAEKAAEQEPEFVLPPQIKEAYKTVGGTPHLDGSYTVFGEVVSGMEVIDKIAALPTDANNRPMKDVKMWMEQVK